MHDQREIDAVVAVLQARDCSTSAPQVAEFERRGAELLAKRHGVMVNSGTSALWLAVDLLGCEPGDEVITSPLTFSSDIAPLVRIGHRARVRRRRTRHVPDRRRRHRGDDRAADQGDPHAEPRRQLPRLGSHPRDRRRARPARGRGQLRRARLVPARHAHRPARRHRRDELRPRPLDDRGGQRRHDRRRRRRVVRPVARAPALGPPVRDLPVRQPEGQRRRFGPLADGTPYDLIFVFDDMGYNFEPSEIMAAYGLVQMDKLAEFNDAASTNFDALDEALAKHDDKVVRPRTTDGVDTTWMRYPFLLARRHRPHRGAGVLPRAQHPDPHGVDGQHPAPARLRRHPAPAPAGGLPQLRPRHGPRLSLPMHHGLTATTSATSSSRSRSSCAIPA